MKLPKKRRRVVAVEAPRMRARRMGTQGSMSSGPHNGSRDAGHGGGGLQRRMNAIKHNHHAHHSLHQQNSIAHRPMMRPAIGTTAASAPTAANPSGVGGHPTTGADHPPVGNNTGKDVLHITMTAAAALVVHILLDSKNHLVASGKEEDP